MTEVIVERQWAAPLTDADMQMMMGLAEGCLGIHRVTWCGSLLSADGQNLFCHFRGPDAESVRIAVHPPGAPAGTVWPCRIHDAPGFTAQGLTKVNVVVRRRFDEPVDFDTVQALEDSGADCLRAHRVRAVRTYHSADGRRMICLYHAPDAESVRIAQREAEMPLEGVWSVRRFEP